MGVRSKMCGQLLGCVITLLLTALAVFTVFAQQEFSGNIRTADGAVVSGASVSVKRQTDGLAVWFKISDARGAFRFTLSDTVQPEYYYIEVNHLSYERVKTPLTKGKVTYNFTVYPRVQQMDEIQVGAKPKIVEEGDTLSYRVASFAQQTDRSIGDALRRMPGIAVEDNGRIKFQGQAISNLYIDGDDLLEGKYGLGTRAIPYAMVLDIQVLKNHQPIKVLQGRIVSTDVAINLVIKDEAKLKMSGEAKLGGGWPEQYFADVSTMLFNNKHKLLHVLKANNTGVDLTQDMEELVRMDMQEANPYRLSAGTVGDPQLPKMRYFLNNSGGVFAKDLFNLKRNWQVKADVDLFLERSLLNYANRSVIYTGADSVVFLEDLQRVERPFHVDVGLRANKNVNNSYIDNKLELRLRRLRTTAELYRQDDGLSQRLSQQLWSFNNRLGYIPMLRNQDVLRFNWEARGTNQPEMLSVSPSSHVSALDPSAMYERLSQRMAVRTLTSDAGLEYAPNPGKIGQRYKLNVLQDWESLGSSVSLFDISEIVAHRVEGNDLSWRRTKATTEAIYMLKRSKSEWSLHLPVAFQYIDYRDPRVSMQADRSDWLFTPSLFGKVRLSAASELMAQYRYENVFSGMQTVYQHAILTNYRTMLANDALLQQHRTHRTRLEFRTGNVSEMLFYNGSYQYSRTVSNTVTSMEVEDDLTRIVVLALNNAFDQHDVSSEVTKFIFFLGANSGIRAHWATARQNQIVNGELLPYRNNAFTLTPELGAKLFRKVDLRYFSSFSWYRNEPITGGALFSQRLFAFNQHTELTYSPKNHIHIGVKGQQLYSAQHGQPSLNYYFVDADLRYKVAPWNVELELNLTNMTNVKTFEYAALMTNYAFYNRYEIRGRMALLKAIFVF